MTAKEVVKLLEADGWVLKATVGSHRQYVHPTKKGKITVPMHRGDTPPGTLNSIIKAAGLK